ncbi:MAG: T9SS type A sorting domain-containing protein [Bacteroidetes bacterium]|nr:T9SS type A sorting domain-containing protein [Bacteroidota bacterium]
MKHQVSGDRLFQTRRKREGRACALSRHVIRRFAGCLLLCTVFTATQVDAQDREVRMQRVLSERVQERTVNSKRGDIISAQVAASEADSTELVRLYNLSGGASWFDNSGWLQEPVSQWYGVTLDDDGRVVSVDLSGNGLAGLIPSGIGTMEKLEILDLSENGLFSSIPVSLSNLSSLRELILWGNQLTGPIPPELGQMPALEKLSLFLNQLSGPIPPELGSIKTLKRLFLDFNGLEGTIPVELANIDGLIELFVDANSLTGILPPELAQLRSLESLFVGHNELTGPIPAELATMPALQNLSLEGNQHTGTIPSELTMTGDLTKLILAHNLLSGPIPEGFGGVTSLGTLDLEGNQLTGNVPFDLGISANMRILNLSDNLLTGEVNALPVTLDELHLRQNQLSGDFPSIIGPLTSLRKIDLRENAFSGTLEVIYGHQRLIDIRLSNNQFTGGFSPPRRTIYYLEYLDLANNDLHEIGALTEWAFLDTVDVSGNQLNFTDLLSNVGLINRDSFTYAPQDSLITWVQRTDAEVIFSVADSADGNVYQWYRDGNALDGANSVSIRVDANEPVAEYYCEVTNDMLPNLTLISEVKSTDSTPTRRTNPLPEKIETITVGQNFPNPFQMGTAIPISLTEPGLVEITIYNITGRKAQSIRETLSAGEHVVWITTTGLASGSYRYVVHAGEHHVTRSMMLVK